VKIESSELYDVICVGGGPAGLSLLTALRKMILFCVGFKLIVLRQFSCNIIIESRPDRSSGFGTSQNLEASKHRIFKSCQLFNTVFEEIS
jgi:hypothetical protein